MYCERQKKNVPKHVETKRKYNCTTERNPKKSKSVALTDKVIGFFVRKFYDYHMNLILCQIVSILDTMIPTCSLTILLIQLSLIIEMIPRYDNRVSFHNTNETRVFYFQRT